VRGSASSRNEHERESAGLGDSVFVGSRERGRLARSGGAGCTLGGAQGCDKRPEVKSREYWWNGISDCGGSMGSGAKGRVPHVMSRSSIYTRCEIAVNSIDGFVTAISGWCDTNRCGCFSRPDVSAR
jgi:hypothetical protein